MLSGIFITLFLLYVYQIQYSAGDYPSVHLEDLLRDRVFKTGDIILFKAANNFNSIFINSYWGHIGIVYVRNDQPYTPYIFEAMGIEGSHFRARHNPNGIFLSPLRDRISKYKGRCWLKPLNQAVDIAIANRFMSFIQYAIRAMYYDKNIVRSSLRKIIKRNRCGKNTNCGELVFLSLIKLGLLHEKEYNQPACHYLKWMAGIEKLNDQYEYLAPLEIIDHPFAA